MDQMIRPLPAATMRNGDPLDPHRHSGLHPALDGWRANVGGPVELDLAPPAAAALAGIDVLCWNMAVGLGDLDRLLEVLRRSHAVAASAFRPLVILAQEVYRHGGSVPADSVGRAHGGLAPAAARACITDIARRHGLSLRYSPSMRNGAHPSDRGNAILSSVSLARGRAHLLPYVRQRRVAVATALEGHEGLMFVSAHLDTHGRTRTQQPVPDAATPPEPRVPSGSAGVRHGRAAQARELAAFVEDLAGTVVLGADLNSVRGMSDRAVRELIAAGMHPARRSGNWRHTFHRPLPLLLDHVLYRCSTGRLRSAEVVRIDEAPRDRSPTVFGSDHHPLLARIELNG